MKEKILFTSESVTEGHPDKLCDQIADRILDELLKQDPHSRCGCEVTAEPGAVHIMGEITSRAAVDYAACARDVIRAVGYTDPDYGFTDQCRITSTVHRQSQDVAMGISNAYDDPGTAGAGDMGMMFGYACRETPVYMPLAIQLANDLTRRLSLVRKRGILPYLRPDGKAQVTVEYEDGRPVRVDTVVLAAQHDPHISMAELRRDLMNEVVFPTIDGRLLDDDTRYLINPTGRFVEGGPAADTGLTGRKIIADTYGGRAGHGGGAFSGKDPTKVDRSGAYMARFLAKHIVAAGLADRCEIQLSYAIGVSQPVSLWINTFGTGSVSEERLQMWIRENLDLRPAAIIERLKLRNVSYVMTAAYGHFGKGWLPWEQFDPALLRGLEQLAV